jgi:hypothetical protein
MMGPTEEGPRSVHPSPDMENFSYDNQVQIH